MHNGELHVFLHYFLEIGVTKRSVLASIGILIHCNKPRHRFRRLPVSNGRAVEVDHVLSVMNNVVSCPVLSSTAKTKPEQPTTMSPLRSTSFTEVTFLAATFTTPDTALEADVVGAREADGVGD